LKFEINREYFVGIKEIIIWFKKNVTQYVSHLITPIFFFLSKISVDGYLLKPNISVAGWKITSIFKQ
jgi:hypothetical protein